MISFCSLSTALLRTYLKIICCVNIFYFFLNLEYSLETFQLSIIYNILNHYRTVYLQRLQSRPPLYRASKTSHLLFYAVGAKLMPGYRTKLTIISLSKSKSINRLRLVFCHTVPHSTIIVPFPVQKSL